MRNMKTITILGIDSALERAIKSKAKMESLSANQWILQALRKVTGLNKEPVYKIYHDLDHLAGGWSREETEAFLKNTEIFEKI
jgi:hypothetical protein